jgi:RimJ/RimL family protein N-acetyltransferase
MEPDMAQTMRTKRLLLRPLEMSDAPRMAVFTRAPEIARMSSSMPLVQPDIGAEGFILITQARAHLKREHVFAVELPGVGLIGVASAIVGASDVEIGYWIGKPYWSQGYGTEVAIAIADYAEALRQGPVIAYHFADNPSSGRVLEKAGFAATGDVHQLYALARAETVASHLMVYRGDAKLAA